MKRIYKTLLLISLPLFLLSGCTKFLDIKPFGKAIPHTAEDYETLLNNRLNDIDYGLEKDIIGNLEETADLSTYGDNFEPALDQASNSLGVSVVSFLSGKEPFYKYERLYQTIRDCNIILDNVKMSNDSLSKGMLSATYALRGVCYYQLLRNYCEAPKGITNQLGVPLVQHFSMTAMPQRSSMPETIQQIERDLTTALSTTSNEETFRFTSDVIKGYLARLYFWTKQWDKAITYADQILTNHPIISGMDYVKMLTTDYGTQGNILLKSPLYQENSNRLLYESYRGSFKVRPLSKRFIDCFYNEKDKDIRYKYFINKDWMYSKSIFASLRSAELLLIEAESYYHKGQEEKALMLINELRAKRLSDYTPLTMATLPPLRPSELITTDAEGKAVTPLLNLILTERRKELCLEGDRWYELKRNGSPAFWQSFNMLKYTTEPYMYTFPLPITDIKLLHTLKQNPGYETIIQ